MSLRDDGKGLSEFRYKHFEPSGSINNTSVSFFAAK